MFSKLKKLFKSDQLPKHKPDSETPAKDLDNRSAVPLKTEKNQALEPLIKTTVERLPVQRPLPVMKRNRKGIRVIDKHQDIHDLFPDDAIVSDSALEANPVSGPAIITCQKTVTAKKSPFKSAARTTRNGFPILDDMDDFSLFMNKENGHVERIVAQDKPSGHPIVGDQQEKRTRLRNKHGIPMLPDSDSWIAKDNSYENEKNEFMRLLNDSLGGKTRDVLMNEKGVRTIRKKQLSLKEKVKRYPLPQSQLDLHGYTAIKAELRSESFLKHAYGNQLHTVIVIVGKGLHSDEGAVLPDVIEMLLIRLRKEGIVLFYEWENEKKSRSGAVTVYLNNMVFE